MNLSLEANPENVKTVLRIPEEEIKQLIDQPLDGLLCDIDLCPEQCVTGWAALVYRVVKTLHEKAYPGK